MAVGKTVVRQVVFDEVQDALQEFGETELIRLVSTSGIKLRKYMEVFNTPLDTVLDILFRPDALELIPDKSPEDRILDHYLNPPEGININSYRHGIQDVLKIQKVKIPKVNMTAEEHILSLLRKVHGVRRAYVETLARSPYRMFNVECVASFNRSLASEQIERLEAFIATEYPDFNYGIQYDQELT